MRFKEKIVWITGASSGIGEALAHAFYSEGARLILSSRRLEELARVRDNCHGTDKDIVLLPLDLADIEDLPRRAEQALAAFGRIDILVNNGGIGQRARAMETCIRVDEMIMRVNYLGQIALTKAVLPAMVERKAGHIVVISSVVGKIGAPMRSAYAASKHALHGFFDSLRLEIWQDQIKITLVCPGTVRTELRANALDGQGVPRGKMALAHENAISAEACAATILEAIAQGKEEIYIGRNRFAVYAARLFPGLVSQVMRRMKNL